MPRTSVSGVSSAPHLVKSPGRLIGEWLRGRIRWARGQAEQPLNPSHRHSEPLRAPLSFARGDSESAALGPRWRRRRKGRGSRVEIEIGVGPAGGGSEAHPARRPGLSSLWSHLCLVTAFGEQGCVLGRDNSFGKEVCTSNPAEIGVRTPWGWRRGTRGRRTVGASHRSS